MRSRAGQGLHLGAALDLKDADGVRFTAERVYLWVLEVERVQVRPGSRVGLDQVERLRHHREHAQAEHVHLDQPELLHVVLVELDDHPARHGGALHRHDVDQWFAGDKHSSHVDGEMAREFQDLGR